MKLSGSPRHDHYIPTADQVHELAVALPQRYSAIAYPAAACDLRGAEITWLELESRQQVKMLVKGSEPARFSGS